MRINRSLGETDLLYRCNNKLRIGPNNSDNLNKLNIQKAQSFKQEWNRQDLSTGLCIKWKPKNYEISENWKNNKHPSTNRIEPVSKDAIKGKSKVKIRRKWCNGKGGWTGDLPPTKIKIIMKPLTHLDSHPINVAISNINKFIHQAFKIKNKDDYDIPAIINAGKTLGIVFSKTQIVDHNFLRSREFLSFSKEKILKFLYSVINKSNGNIEPDNSKALTPFHQNRFFVGKGNNYILVRSVIKQRWWWSMNESEDFFNVNFIWTQWKKNKHLSILDSK